MTMTDTKDKLAEIEAKIEAEYSHIKKPDSKDLSLYDELVAEFKVREKYNRRKVPYVLWGYIGKERKEKKFKWVPRLFKLKCGGIHSSRADFERYASMGRVIVDFWIPTPKDLPPKPEGNGIYTESGWRLDLRNSPGKFRKLRQLVAQYKGETGAIHEAKQEALTYKDKLAKAEAELAKMKGKKHG